MYKETWYQNLNSLKKRFLILSIVSVTLISCDPADDVSVQEVNEEITISDTELQSIDLIDHQKLFRQSTQNITYYFGFDLRSSPQEDAAQYVPFLKYLQEATGYQFKLHFTPKNSTTIEQLGNNITQLAAMGATSFLDAQIRYNVQVLVRGLNHQDKAEYQSVFVTKPESNIRTINDIKGHKLAFGSIDSTQGHLIPRIMLKQHGIRLKDLKSYTYTGSHQNCAEAVVSGKFDVCGMQDQLAKNLSSKGFIKIIHTSNYYPSSGIVANDSVSPEALRTIKQALLAFKPAGKHSHSLYHWDRTEMPKGFVEADEKDYGELRKWAVSLGFLQAHQ